MILSGELWGVWKYVLTGVYLKVWKYNLKFPGLIGPYTYDIGALLVKWAAMRKCDGEESVKRAQEQEIGNGSEKSPWKSHKEQSYARVIIFWELIFFVVSKKNMPATYFQHQSSNMYGNENGTGMHMHTTWLHSSLV